MFVIFLQRSDIYHASSCYKVLAASIIIEIYSFKFSHPTPPHPTRPLEQNSIMYSQSFFYYYSL